MPGCGEITLVALISYCRPHDRPVRTVVCLPVPIPTSHSEIREQIHIPKLHHIDAVSLILSLKLSRVPTVRGDLCSCGAPPSWSATSMFSPVTSLAPKAETCQRSLDRNLCYTRYRFAHLDSSRFEDVHMRKLHWLKGLQEHVPSCE